MIIFFKFFEVIFLCQNEILFDRNSRIPVSESFYKADEMVHFPEKIRVNYVAFKLRYAWKIVRHQNKAKTKPIMPKPLIT